MDREYSIWLVPDMSSQAFAKLQGAIRRLSDRYDDAPSFDPHITVVGGLNKAEGTVKRNAERLVQGRSSFDINLCRPFLSTTRHQCVFLLAEPSETLIGLHEEASEIFGVSPSTYIPHVSTMYSDISVSERRKLLEELRDSDLPTTFEARAVWVMDTTASDEREWSAIEKYWL